MEDNDFFADYYLGFLTYAFKPDLMCTLVKFGVKEVWKKGDHRVEEPKSVTYDSILREVTVRDNKRALIYKDTLTGGWRLVNTIVRSERFKTVKAQIHKEPASGSLRSRLSSFDLELGDFLNDSTGSGEGTEDSYEPFRVTSEDGDAWETSGGNRLRSSTAGDGVPDKLSVNSSTEIELVKDLTWVMTLTKGLIMATEDVEEKLYLFFQPKEVVEMDHKLLRQSMALVLIQMNHLKITLENMALEIIKQTTPSFHANSEILVQN
nr:hypothetical protein MACL_00001348 [Theileria orientalis]